MGSPEREEKYRKERKKEEQTRKRGGKKKRERSKLFQNFLTFIHHKKIKFLDHTHQLYWLAKPLNN